MLCPIPTANIGEIFFQIGFRAFGAEVFALPVEIPFEVTKKTDFFLQLIGIVREIILLADIFPGNLLNIKKVFCRQM